MGYVYKITYFCYQSKMRILLNNQSLSLNSAIMKYMDEPFYVWADKLLDLLFREIEEDYYLEFYGRDFEAEVMEKLVQGNAHCIGFLAHRLAIDTPLQQRLITLSHLIKKYPSIHPGYTKISVVFVGAKNIIAKYEDLITQLDVRNQYIAIDFSIQHFSEYTPKKDEIPFFIFTSISEAEKCIRKPVVKYGFCLIEAQTTELIGFKDGILKYAFNINDFFDTVFRCCLQFPLTMGFANCVKRAVTKAKDGAIQKELRTVLAEKPLIELLIQPRIELNTSNPVKIGSVPPDSVIPELTFRYQVPGIVECDRQYVRGLREGKTRVLVYERGEAEPMQELLFEVYKRNRIQSICLSDYKLSMGCGDVRDINITYEPSDADNVDKIIWYSSSPNIAQVEKGKVHAISQGNCQIWCSAETVSVSCEVNIKKYLSDIILSPKYNKPVELITGETVPLEFSCTPENAYDGKIKIVSSDMMVVTVQNGTIVATGPGAATITIENESGRIRRQMQIIVRNPKQRVDSWKSFVSKFFL